MTASISLSLAMRMLAGISVAASALVPTAAFADDDQAAGQRIFAVRCASCHGVNAGDKKVGPTLAGVFGSGSVADFEYSPALKGAHLTWDGATLDKWLQSPPGLVRGTTMFVSVPSAADRGKLIAYLKSLSPGAQTSAVPNK
jgi:cytochrome c